MYIYMYITCIYICLHIYISTGDLLEGAENVMSGGKRIDVHG